MKLTRAERNTLGSPRFSPKRTPPRIEMSDAMGPRRAKTRLLTALDGAAEAAKTQVMEPPQLFRGARPARIGV